MNKTNGGVGTNQYKIKGVAKPKNEKLRVRKNQKQSEVTLPNSYDERVELAYNTTDTDILDELTKIRNKDVPGKVNLVALRIANNPNVSAHTQRELLNDHWITRVGLAQNENAIPEVQEKLANDKNETVRQSLAGNPSLSAEFQKKLAKDPSQTVKIILTENPNISSIAQKTLAGDENELVKRYLAQIPNMTPECQEKLSDDKSWKVRAELAENKNISQEIREKLLKDEDSWVREVAQRKKYNE
jgi:hypothetical protein